MSYLNISRKTRNEILKYRKHPKDILEPPAVLALINTLFSRVRTKTLTSLPKCSLSQNLRSFDKRQEILFSFFNKNLRLHKLRKQPSALSFQLSAPCSQLSGHLLRSGVGQGSTLSKIITSVM